MVTQLHNFTNIFITSSPDFQAISLDCQVVKRLTRALSPLLQWHRYLFALLRERPLTWSLGPCEFEVGQSPAGLGRQLPSQPLSRGHTDGDPHVACSEFASGALFWGLCLLGALHCAASF